MHIFLIKLGSLLIIFNFVCLILKIEQITRWTTPIFWSGYVILLEGILIKLRKRSLIIENKFNSLLICLLSIFFWYIFEFYNLFIKNWEYINLPESVWIRLFGYFWAFATILPGIMLTAELLSYCKIFQRRIKPLKITKKIKIFYILIGCIFLILPIVIPYPASNYLAFMVWTCFFLLLDPLNYKQKSILKDLESGDLQRLLVLVFSGFICGFLWEAWNYKAYTKWIYTFNILPQIKIFEMPILGYFGFPAFALELFAMWQFSKKIIKKLNRITEYGIVW